MTGSNVLSALLLLSCALCLSEIQVVIRIDVLHRNINESGGSARPIVGPPIGGLDLRSRSAGAVAFLPTVAADGRIGLLRHDASHSNGFLVILLCLGRCLASRSRPNVVPAPPTVRIARASQSRPCSSFAHSNSASSDQSRPCLFEPEPPGMTGSVFRPWPSWGDALVFRAQERRPI